MNYGTLTLVVGLSMAAINVGMYAATGAAVSVMAAVLCAVIGLVGFVIVGRES